MEVYGLVGKSGTGKSYQALGLCRELNIPCLIDDGLFIGKNRIFGGKSAKRQDTMLGAIKTALFTDDDHKEEVVQAIKKRDPESILILGTSDRMVYKIAERLELPVPKELIQIEDICTPEDIENAAIERRQNGKHAIPVATFQLKREFSGYFLKPLKIFRHVGSRKTVVAEKSEVRPTFSYLGGYIISERAIYDIVKCCSMGLPDIVKLLKQDLEKADSGIIIYAEIMMRYGAVVRMAAESIQQKIKHEVEEMTGFNVLEVRLTVKGLA